MEKKFGVKMLALCGMLAALCAVLGFLAEITDFQTVKVSFEGLPVLIAAILYGPLAGMAVGGIGTTLSQCLGKYGPQITTPLWILPYFAAGLVVGLMTMRKKYRCKQCNQLVSVIKKTGRPLTCCGEFMKPYSYTMFDYFKIITVSEILITVINTCGIYIASKIQGWYHPGIITGNLLIRFFIMVAKIFIYAFIVPILIKVISKIDNNQYQ